METSITFLELCQRTARESGVIQGTKPSTVIGQVGTLAQLVEWVADAWVEIQTEEKWPWLRTDFSKNTVASIGSYSPTAWSLTGHGEWITEPQSTSLYLTSTGVSDESWLSHIPYTDYQLLYRIGTQTDARPVHWSISPTGNFLLGPEPDAVYTVHGEYYKSPQVLATNSDTPTGLPVEFENIIVYKAVQRFGEFDEAANAIALAAQKYTQMLNRMRRRLMPVFESPGGWVM